MTFFPSSFNPVTTIGGTLSNGNTTFTTPINTNPGGLAFAHDQYNSGQYYVEFTVSGATVGHYTGIGICPGSNPLANIQNQGVNAGLIIIASGAVWQILANGVVLDTVVGIVSTGRLAVDLDKQLFWVAGNPTANWNDNPAANPVTGAGGFALPFGNNFVYLFGTTSFDGVGTQVVNINFGQNTFAHAVPSGYQPGWPTLVPAIPTGLGISNPTSTSLTANWNSVPGPESITYTLQYRVTGTIPWTQIVGIATTTQVVTGLIPGTEYDFQIQAENINANSGFSSTVNGFTISLIPTNLFRKQENLKVGYDFINWVLGTDRAIMAHLYQFTSASGAVDYFTDFDIDINWNNVTWKSSSLRFEGLHRKVAIGVNVDEQTLKIWSSPTDTMFGSAFLGGIEQGLMDGAIIVRYRIVWPFVTGNVAADIQNQPIAVWPLFTGYTAAVTKGGASHVELKVKSGLHKLDVNMPRNYYQPGCLWTLFDQGCTLIKASFAVTGTVGASPSNKIIPISGGIANPAGLDLIQNYAQGRLLFTSGINNGLQVLIDSNDSTNLYLAYLLNNVPTAGDTITYYPGCSKSFNTCNLKFSNTANFRGIDKVPPVMVSV